MPRPQKLKNPRAIVMHVEAELKDEWDKLRGRLSWGEFFSTWYLRQKDVIEAVVKIAALEKENEELRRTNAELKELVEHLQARIEKLELENQALKQGRSVRSYQDALKLKELAKHARDGVSWKALCAEVLGLRDEGKIRDLMKLAFVVKKNLLNKFPEKFYPKDIAEEFHGWVLVRPEGQKVADIIDYELYREDTLKAAEELEVGEAIVEKVPEVKPLKSGPAAERWIEITLEVIYHEYMEFIGARQGKRAKEFIEVEAQSRIERTLEAVDPADARRAAFAVLEKHEAEWNDAFVSNLRRVLTRILNTGQYARPLEVTSDV